MDEDNLQRSRQIASVLGPVLLAVTISETVHFGIWEENYPPLTYLNGMLLFAAGLALIRFHRHWRPFWTASIPITGWLMTAGGLMRLFFPRAEQMQPGPAAYGFIGFLSLLGLIMTFNAYLGGRK